MKLWCRKCDKEINNYKVITTLKDGIYDHWVVVVCHRKLDSMHFSSIFSKFNPSDYGDQFFFEKDEPKEEYLDFFRRKDKEWEELRDQVSYIPEILRGGKSLIWTKEKTDSEREWCKSVRELSNFIKKLSDHLDFLYAKKEAEKSDASPENDCCKKWRYKELKYYEKKHPFNSYLERRIIFPTFCPECGKKL